MAGPEAKIEAYLVKRCKEIGGIAEKYTSPNKRSVPDRLCQFPQDTIVFVELKATGKKPTKLQEHDHSVRRQRGHQVYVIDSKEGVDNFIKEMATTIDLKTAIGDIL